MEEKVYKITLADGTIISNLRLNGNNYISDVSIDQTVFANHCSPVVINDGANSVTHANMELVQVTEVNGKYWFVLRDISSEELLLNKNRSDIEYLAMMANIKI